MDIDPRILEVLLTIHRDLPRQGPGDDASTCRALALCDGLPDEPLILDVGCGPGMQTLALAQATSGQIIAVDLFRQYLEELHASERMSSRITALQANMAALPFASGRFDLIWAEGAAYIIGIEQALMRWKRLLKPGGCIAFTDLVWLQSEPPEAVRAFFAEEYPAMTSVDAILQTLAASGYEVAGHFTLPDAAWWDDYYTPLSERLSRLSASCAGDALALSVIAMTQQEIAMRQHFPEAYGYEFFVARLGG